MKREKLIQEITHWHDTAEDGWAWSIVRSVVDFHNPAQISIKMIICDGCSWGELTVPYPCPTIKLIEREI